MCVCFVFLWGFFFYLVELPPTLGLLAMKAGGCLSNRINSCSIRLVLGVSCAEEEMADVAEDSEGNVLMNNNEYWSPERRL